VANSSALWGISIAAIVIAVIGLVGGVTSMDEFEEVTESEESYVPQTREIYLFTEVDEHIDEEKMAIPPDMFSQDTIVVKEGDRVKIHFYNLEPIESQEHHTFTINDPAYNIHNDINAEENTVIEFTSSKEGVYDYLCTYHQPTMRGELVVLPSDD
jgi:plastocyanin